MKYLYFLILSCFSVSASVCKNGAVSICVSEHELYKISSKSLLFKVNGVKFRMLAVKGGKFMMGSNNGGNDEKPEHQVTLDDYYIGETEVTQELWFAVMGTTIQEQLEKETYDFGLAGVGDEFPMYYINYYECVEFVDKLNELLKDELPHGRKFRIPTEAEWEYAARGGKKKKRYEYSGSDVVEEVAVRDGGFSPVKEKKCNKLDIYDMSGSVYEWCSDYYESSYYSNSPEINPKGPGYQGSSMRVLRNGRGVHKRSHEMSNVRNYFYGLRLAL